MPWSDLPGDLERFAAELGRVEETELTSRSLITYLGHFRQMWKSMKCIKLSTVGVPIPPPRRQNLHPSNCEVSYAEIRFIFELGNEFKEKCIPLRADFQVCVRGSLTESHCIVELEDHWRVDSHFFPEDPPPREPHPYFHFQRGGHAQTEFVSHESFVPGTGLAPKSDDCWRGLMQSPGPRVPFIPHCPILAIDFAIGQHDGPIWSKLRGSSEYRALIKKAQGRLWTPFFDGLSRADVRKRYMGPVFCE